MNEGPIVSSDGLDLAPADWGTPSRGTGPVVERAPGAHPRRRGRTCSGPRHASRSPATALHPLAAAALARPACRRDRTNVFRSIVARAVELVHALAEAADIIDGYAQPAAPLSTGRAAGHRSVGDRGAARPALPSLRGRRGGPSPRADRAADQPEPGGHRGRPAAFAPASSTCHTTRRRIASSSSSAATTRASPARPTSWTCGSRRAQWTPSVALLVCGRADARRRRRRPAPSLTAVPDNARG